MRLIDADGLYIPPEEMNAKMAVAYAPTVEAEPVRHGEWIRTGRTNIYGGTELECNLCKDRVMVQDVGREHYCRNCGAKMDEAEP